VIIKMPDAYEKHGPIRIFDANGLEWSNVVWANTETGEIIRQVVEGGELLIVYGNIIHERVKAAAPLRVELMR